MIVPVYTVMFNYRGKTRKKGAYPVHIRIYISGQPRQYLQITTPGGVTPAQWSGKERAWVKNTHPYAFEINNEIEEKLETLTSLNKRYIVARKQLTMQRIFQELKMDYNSELFNEFYEAILKQPPEEMTPANLKRYYAALSSLNKFNAMVHFYELDEEFFQRLKKHQREIQLLVPSTIRGYFNAYKKILKWSRYNAHLSREKEKEVMEGINHRRADKANRDFLEVHYVLEWQNYVFEDKYIRYKRDRDMFLLEIFTGYYYGDLKALLKSELRLDPEYGHYLYNERFKNGNLAIVPLWKFRWQWI